MSQITWQWKLDRAVRYALSDPISSVEYCLQELEQTQSTSCSIIDTERHNRSVETWRNYSNQLYSLHRQLLSLPDLTTVTWLPENAIDTVPRFMPFITSIKDSKVKLIRVIRWLRSLETRWITSDSRIDVLINPQFNPQYGKARIPYGSHLDQILAYQDYLHQLETVYQQLISIVGPDQSIYQDNTWSSTRRDIAAVGMEALK